MSGDNRIVWAQGKGDVAKYIVRTNIEIRYAPPRVVNNPDNREMFVVCRGSDHSRRMFLDEAEDLAERMAQLVEWSMS